MQVRAGVLKRVNHVVRHIRAGTRFGIDPSVPPMYKRQRSPQHKVGDYVHTWAISIASALLSRRLNSTPIEKRSPHTRLSFPNHSDPCHPAFAHGKDRVRAQREGTAPRGP